MVEAAVARLITPNVHLCSVDSKLVHLKVTGLDDIEIYGKQAICMIKDHNIYELCKKAIVHYDQLPLNAEGWFISVLSEYDKNDDSIISAIRNGFINTQFEDIFDMLLPETVA